MTIIWGGGPMALPVQRLIERTMRPGVLAKHGRVVRPGQIWRANDPRRLRGVRVLDIELSASKRQVTAQDIVSGKVRTIPLRNFTIGRDGWSLDKEAN